MNILVTGGNGYLGQGVVEQLVKDGHNVIATDISENCNIGKKCRYIKTDIFKLTNPYLFFDKPDVVLHMAWKDGFKHNSESHINDLHLHYSFLSKCIDDGCKQIAVMGSMHEVGFYEGSIDEYTPTNPQSLYGIAKNTLRQLMELKCKSTNVVLQWIRGFYIVGNTERGCSIFSKITQAAHNNEKVFPFTQGQNQYDFLDYNDFCFQVATIIEQRSINGIINACSAKPTKLADRVEQFIRDNNFDVTLKYGAFPDRPYDSKAVWGNDTKISIILDKRK